MGIMKRCRFYPCDYIAPLISSHDKVSDLIYSYGLLDMSNIMSHDEYFLKCDLCMLEYFREELKKNPAASVYSDFAAFRLGYNYCVIEHLYRSRQDKHSHFKKWWQRLWKGFHQACR